jgi:LAO/AO transport system kinase
LSLVFNNRHPEFFINGILSGDITILSRAITLVESQNADQYELARRIVNGVSNKRIQSFRLAITGVPGVGKSTLIESFGKEIIKNGHRLAVLAIDPSSSKSKGSILGDKTRMENLSTQKNVFIRPSPNSGTLGGVTRVSYETILLCEAAGFDYIIVETVGVGQSEIAVSKITDFFLLLMLAGAGDELQGIKRGIMEMADALVITKADGENLNKAKSARAEYAHAMHLLQQPTSGWIPKTMICSGITNMGIEAVYQMIESYRQMVTASGYFYEKRRSQQYELFLNAVDEQLKQRFYFDQEVQRKINEIKVSKNTEDFQPFSAAKLIIEQFFKK